MGDEWSSDANETVSIELIYAGEHSLEIVDRFHPKFTYPIFGDEERIFGYKGLNIAIRFSAHDLRPNISISYKSKFAAIAETSALDVETTLKKFVPASAFSRPIDYEQSVQNDPSAHAFTPPGKLVTAYTRGQRQYEVWAASLLDRRVRETVDRMQVFVSFFIEGGTPLDTEDADWTKNRWTVYFVYEKLRKLPSSNTSPYSFIGYATTYRFFTFRPRYQTSVRRDQGVRPSEGAQPLNQDISPASLPSRLRISQFLILPPYQFLGHGSALYSAIYSNALADDTVHELTVEDPSEEFDKLRDINDWKILAPCFAAADVKIKTTALDHCAKHPSARLPTSKLLDLTTTKYIRSDKKMAPRQFSRQLEMYLLSRVPFSHRAAGGANLTRLLMQKARVADSNDKSYYWWRLIVKQRVYRQNREVLLQLEGDQKHQRLAEAARAEEDEYERLLSSLEAPKANADVEAGNGDGSDSQKGPVRDKKRKLIIEEDDDESSDEETPSQKKKAKMAISS